MPITNSMKNKKNPASSISNVRIRRTKSQTTAPMLTQKVAPAGIYTSKITDVTMSKTENGEDAVDVTYELTSANGKVAQGRLRYTLDGFHFERFSDAMIDAGVPEDSPITEAVGIEEEIEVVYPQRNSLAKIKSRHPLNAAKAKQTKAVAAAEVDEEDAEFDDFLPDEEDEF